MRFLLPTLANNMIGYVIDRVELIFPIPASPSSFFLTLERPYCLTQKSSFFLTMETPYCLTRKTSLFLTLESPYCLSRYYNQIKYTYRNNF